jgi:quinol monooxygenase YgiN
MAPTASPSVEPGIVLVAMFHSRPDAVADMARRLAEMVPLTRAEPGCIRYDLHIDSADATHFIFVETWADEASLAAHLASEHVVKLLAKVGELESAPIVVHRLTPFEDLG